MQSMRTQPHRLVQCSRLSPRSRASSVLQRWKPGSPTGNPRLGLPLLLIRPRPSHPCSVIRCEFEPTPDSSDTGWVTADGVGAYQLRVGQPPGSSEALVTLEPSLQHSQGGWGPPAAGLRLAARIRRAC